MKLIDFIIKFASQGDASVVNAASKIQGSIESAEQAADRLSTTVGGKLKQAFMSLPGAEFITNPIVAMTAGIGTVSTLGMQAEKTAKSFDVLVGSQDKAGKMLDEINDYADNTLWSRMDMSEAAQSLLAYSVPAEKVVKDLKMLGDISLGDKNKMSTLATVFGQISTAGRLMTQDYRQLLNVGFNPLYDISQMTGKSMAQLQDEMSKGTITFEMFEQAVIHATSEGGKYNNMIGSLASTTSGKFEQVKGAFIASLLEVYNLIQPLVSAVLSGLNSVLTVLKNVIPHISNLIPVIGGLAAAVAAYNTVQMISNGILKGLTITEGIHYMWLLLVEKAQWLLNAAMSANPIGLVVAAIAALVAGLILAWKKFDGFRTAVKATWDTIKGFGEILKNFVIDRIQGLLTGIGKIGEAIGKLFKGDFSGAWESAKEGVKGITGVEAAQKAASASKNLLGGFKDTYNSRLEQEKSGVSKPGIAGMVETPDMSPSAYGTGTTKSAESITTGGTRNTSINMTITKLIESFNVSMETAEDTNELQDRVTECMNRALEIALSAAR
jgi:hypothetical protein